MLDALRPICEEAAKERNTAHGTLRSLVENEVQKLLPHGKANRQRVAKALALTERTLAQKLGEENTSYEKVVDRWRHSLAVQYITEPSVSVAQIAWLLGYLLQSCFRALDGPIGVRGARRQSAFKRR